MPDVLLLSKTDGFSRTAAEIARIAFGERLEWCAGRVGEPLPREALAVGPRLILSFLSPWIVPAELLERAEIALNWHPGSADYPGIGCYNFALYEEAASFGATCHRMAARVDTGEIIEERLFPVFAGDTVESLKLRTMVTMSAMFHDTVCQLSGGWQPTPCGVSWSRAPFTRRQLEDLKRIDPNMAPDEVRRRVRATTYPSHTGAFVELGDVRFVVPVPERAPLA